MYSRLSNRQLNNYNKDIKPHLELISELRGKGYGIIQIADEIGISHTTLYTYVELVEELDQALERGNKLLVANLEKALWSKALGGLPLKKTTTTTYKNSGEEIKREEIEYSAPDNTAMIFALKSLEPNKYVEKQEIEIKGEIDTQPSFKDIFKNDENKKSTK